MPFEIPSPSLAFEVPLADGARILMRRHGNPDGVRLLVTHGNGFAADAYYPYWRQLLSKFDVLVFDFRNHGRNVPVTPSNHHYAQLANDLERVVQAVNDRLGAKKTAGIFHSMSARSAMKHAIEIGWRWDALVLFDPPDVPPKGHPLYEAMEIFENKLTEWAKGRRRAFNTVDELAEEYRQSRATRNWVPGMHELMARSVLRPSPDGNGFELVCAPENEANIYAQALTLDLWPKRVRVRRSGQADRLRSQLQGRAGDRPGQPGARYRRRVRLQLRRRHRPSPADREARRMRAPDAAVFG